MAPALVAATPRTTPSPVVGFFLRLARMGVVWLVACWGLLLGGPVAWANAPLVAPADWQQAVWVDPGGNATLEQVLAVPASQWVPQQGPYAVGYQPQARWIRLDWPQHVVLGQRYWLEIWPAFLDQLDVYHWRQGRWEHQALGDLRPRASRSIDHRHFVAELRPDTNQPVYVRLQTTSTLLFMAALWTPDEFAANVAHEALFWGAYFGVAALAMAMVMGLAAYLRNVRLAGIGVFVLGFLLVASNQGYLSWLLFPNHLQMGHMASGVLVLWSQAASLWLVATSLNLPQHHPRWWHAYRAAALLLAVSSVVVPLGWYNSAIGGLFLLATSFQLGSLLLGWQLWRRLRSYGLVTLGFAFYTLSSLLAVATVTGLLPFHVWLYEFWQYVLTALMLAIAYFALLQVRDDHLRALSEATSRLLATREASELLSQQVAERTHELAQARDALQVSLINEQEARAQERQFIGILSHEFRTPLAIIDSSVEVLQATPPEDEDRMLACLDHIRQANQRLVQLTDTCLADARLESGLQPINPSPFDWEELIHSAAQQADLPVETDSLRIAMDLRPDTPRPAGDLGLLRILLSNLLDNAAKYAKGQPVSLQVQATPAGWSVRVTDQGPGMPPAEWERVFERFVRLPETRALHGAGLGLYVCRQIARAHGGDVRVLASRPGAHTMEWWLPRRAAPAEDSNG